MQETRTLSLTITLYNLYSADKTKVSKTNGSLIKVESIAEFCNALTYIKRKSVLENIFFILFLSGRLRQALVYGKTCYIQKIGFQDRLLLNAGQKYCRMILQYFRPSLSNKIFKTSVLSDFE